MKTASAVPGARATALNPVSRPHTAPTPARPPGGAPSLGKNQHLQGAEPLSPPLWEGRGGGGFQRGPTLGLRPWSRPTRVGAALARMAAAISLLPAPLAHAACTTRK